MRLHHLFFIHIHGQLRHHKLLLPVTQYLVIVHSDRWRCNGNFARVSWLAGDKNPSQESQLWEAFEKLGKEMYALTDVQRFDKNEWAEIEIPRGLGQRLSHDIKQFKKELQEKRSSM